MYISEKYIRTCIKPRFNNRSAYSANTSTNQRSKQLMTSAKYICFCLEHADVR